MSKQKTAMQIAIDEFKGMKNPYPDTDLAKMENQTFDYAIKFCEQLKANDEREQMMKGDILVCSLRGMTADESRKTAERYYNETYGDNT